MTVYGGTGGPFNTGRVGFGCAYITGGFEKRRNLKLLRSAFDNGIRHYDTAPMYGHGTSEDVVGEAFKKLREKISLTTKVGISRPDFTLSTRLLRAITTPARRHFPKLSQRSAAIIYRSNSRSRNFAVNNVRRSVEDSLSRLNTDYVDVLLLHEATLADITEELLDTLAALESEGKALRLGVGSSDEDIACIDRAYPDFFDVYQRTWSILRTDEKKYPNKTNIYHRSIVDALRPLQDKLTFDLSFAEHMSKATGLELNTADSLAKALICASIFANPKGITLFGTRRLYRVADYAKVAVSDLARGIALLKAYREYVEDAPVSEAVPDEVQ